MIKIVEQKDKAPKKFKRNRFPAHYQEFNRLQGVFKQKTIEAETIWYYTLEDCVLERCETVRDLGVYTYFDRELTFNDHINQIISSASKTYGFIIRICRMPNEYKRKTNRGMASKGIYELASEEVMLRNKSLRDAATSYDINHTSLYRYINKKQAYESNKTIQLPSIGYHRPTVFTKEEEKSLCEYVLTCSDANFGLSTKEARKLALRNIALTFYPTAS
ncbi:unnamed protein product [Acanthoscelides obtectus]|uniref:HTH psq-type domain-containing protein n=1 Tax=Acanthoscelides obtectus TaxID=200917 RepID=A0A9P0L0E6_ACAOB|nr:unnamed protein product [Acanthoscelides obtectus]CAK1651156.1 hypothetical protein AOBTE_LOCUS17097 [Acanthoscelides obtectus]